MRDPEACTLDQDLAYLGRSYPTTESSSRITHSKTGVTNSISNKDLRPSSNHKPRIDGKSELQLRRRDQSKVRQGKQELDVLEEERKKAAIREAKSEEKMEKFYNVKVHSIAFKLGDFVYHSNEASHTKDSGKLDPKWEGPYEIVEALRKGAYKIKNGSGDVLP
ncbi:hypothetical protein Tco_1306355 [Tanacetum coccineum]